MNETENTKETAGEPSKETPKEPKIKKFYKTCALIQNILVGIILILGLIFIIYNVKVFSNIVSLMFVVGFLTCILFIIIGLVLYVLYLLKKTDNSKKHYGKKFILRGIIGLVLIFIIYFILSIIINLFGGAISPAQCPENSEFPCL